MTAGKDGTHSSQPFNNGEIDITCYTSTYRLGLNKDPNLILGIFPLSYCVTLTAPPRHHVPPPQGTIRAVVICAYGCRIRLCLTGLVSILGSTVSGSLLVCITPCATHGQQSVGSHNPVNVEQYLIRSALHQVVTPCVSLNRG